MRFCDVTGLADFYEDQSEPCEAPFLETDEDADRVLAQRRIELLLSEDEDAEYLFGDGYAVILNANLWISQGTSRLGLVVDLLESEDCVIADRPQQFEAALTSCTSTASWCSMDDVLEDATDGLVIGAMVALGRLHVPSLADSMHVWLTKGAQALHKALADGLALPDVGTALRDAGFRLAGRLEEQLPTEECLLELTLLHLGEMYDDATVGHLIRPASIDRRRFH